MKYDLNEVGEIEFSWDFDEDGYREFLEENSYSDSQEAFMEYVNDYVSFDLEYFDSDTYHHMDYDSLSFPELKEEFGDSVANEVLSCCREEDSCRLDQSELYSDDDVSVEDAAMKLLRNGAYFKGCRGFILQNGVVVYTDAEHNMVTRINGVNSKFDFIRMGNIRVLDASLDMCQEPTEKQYNVIEKVLSSYKGETFYLDFFGKSGGEYGVMYQSEEPYRVMNDIRKYYEEGVKPKGDSYESKSGKLVMITESQFNRIMLIN